MSPETDQAYRDWARQQIEDLRGKLKDLGEPELSETLEKIEGLERIASNVGPPGSPGEGVIGEYTREISRGKRQH